MRIFGYHVETKPDLREGGIKVKIFTKKFNMLRTDMFNLSTRVINYMIAEGLLDANQPIRFKVMDIFGKSIRTTAPHQ